MIKGKKLIVILPAYNAAKTLERTYNEIPFDIVDEVVLVDDKSSDSTSELAHQIGIKHVIRHEINKGYGGNQKTCYNKALELGGDIVVMLHPDYQYTPKLIEMRIEQANYGEIKEIGCGSYHSIFLVNTQLVNQLATKIIIQIGNDQPQTNVSFMSNKPTVMKFEAISE